MKRIAPVLTVLLLVLGYSGYYLCRANFSVAKPLLLSEFPELDKVALGWIASVGTGLYALGKFVHGSLADLWSGRRLFLYGMGGAIAFTFLFALGGPPFFLLAWAGNRFVQSAGWGGMVQVASKWFGYRQYGRVMAFISLSYLFGDFASRVFLGNQIARGATWKDLFVIAAVGLGLIMVPCLLLLKNQPEDIGLPAPESSPIALGSDGPRQGLRHVLRPLLTSRSFWTICVLSFGFTMIRETFNEWTPTFLVESSKMTEADAASASSLFPLFGGLSVLAVGFFADRTSGRGRGRILAGGLSFGVIGLALLALLPIGSALALPMVAIIAFAMIGPYSLLAGTISLDFGGSTASASAAGWIDGVGYLGGILSGVAIGKVAQVSGWGPAFGVLAGIAFASSLLAWWYVRIEKRVIV